ncbi:MAG: RagB/SusD family nutrient uptake outer membrane protein [Saprospiraceae bacterium]|nr:RagB/SusD family nutrient uptake outer membrane protein [Saprospiraceae bacterium]
MKNIVLIMGLCVFVFTSCGKDFLELNPQSTIAPETFYKTAADAVTAINGCYKSLAVGGQYASTFQILMEHRADNYLDQDPSSGAGQNFQINRFSDSLGNTNLYTAWVALYSSIFRCNTVLQAIEPIAMDVTLKNRIKGEASFIRALNYFNIVRFWGAAPLVTTTIDPTAASNLKRDAVSDIYAQIEKDLTFAAANVPETYPTAEVGRVTKGAAQGLLAKVYLYQKKFTNAKSTAEEIINGKRFNLLPTIAEVFDPTRKYHAEILFAIRFAKGIAGQDHGYWYANTQIIGLDSTLFKAYDANDARRTQIEFARPTGNSNFMPRKFIDIPVNNNAGNDFPIVRFADILLIQAEAANEVAYSNITTPGSAFANLNAVRKRAGLTELTAANLPDQAAFRSEIYKQRRLEFPFEGDRWFDMVRTGTAVAGIAASSKKQTIEAFRFLYPIPQQEIDIANNKATFPQNPGY